MPKEFWITNSRFKFIALLLFVMWAGFIIFITVEAEAIKDNPCSICAKRLGTEVRCTAGNYELSHITFYPNGTAVEKIPPNPLTLIPNLNVTLD